MGDAHQEQGKAHPIPGVDFIGVGVGALVFDDDGRIFLARRGTEARNETGAWEFPGGTVEYGETLEVAVRREFREEYGMEIKLTGLLGIFDHILPAEQQHWISVTYRAVHAGGTPSIHEPNKCSAIGWYWLSEIPEPVTEITRKNMRAYT